MRKKIINRDVIELKRLNQQVIVELFNEFYNSDIISLARKLKIESLVIASNKDEIATLKSVQKIVNKLDGASFEIIKNAGHFVPLEKPLIIAKIIKNWLKK